MRDRKHVIWSNLNLDMEKWRSDLEMEYPGGTEEEYFSLMHETNREYLEDERMNLDIPLSMPIIVCADLGLWNGRKKGYKMIESGNIRDCLFSECDCNEWYVDRLGDLRCTAVHHDGTNRYLYRAVKENVTEEQLGHLQKKIYYGRATRRDITRYTRRLGDEIAAVYGFDIAKKKQVEMER